MWHRTFVSSSLKKEIPTEKQGNCHGWEVRILFSCCKKDFYIVEKQGSQAGTKIQFKSNQESFRAPVKSGTNLGKLHYTDPDKMTWLLRRHQEPTVDMVSEERFLKAWWNEFFVRYNEL